MMKMTNIRKRRNLRYNTAISALVAFVVIASATVTGYSVTKAVEINMALTDDLIATVYLLSLTLFYLLVSFLRKRR